MKSDSMKVTVSEKRERGYTLYWCRKTSTDRSKSGMAFVVRNGLLLIMSEDPKPESGRLIMLRFLLVDNIYYILITTYALTMTKNPVSTASSLVLFQIQTKLSFLETNAQAGQSHYTWPKVLEMDQANIKSNLVLSIWTEH